MNELPETEYRDAIMRFGTKNVERALIFVAGLLDPRRNLAISLESDDESILGTLEAAFSANTRAELNSGAWEEKLADAIETVRYTMKLPLILLPGNNVMRVARLNGDIAFEGSDWDFVRWVRDEETTMIDVPTLEEVREGEVGFDPLREFPKL